jgi:phosphoenolpyruvate carboxykinase (ATP)
MPRKNILSLHSSCNQSRDNNDTTLFFGLSGTGKTTLSADPSRLLIGDDEHCWTEGGVFNIEGGCYAKCIGLKKEAEPEIWNAIRFGTILENVNYDLDSREVDFKDINITENTRASYPIHFIENAKIPCIAPVPNNIIFLCCDAYGILPPISKLTKEQAMYYFISGYTAKIPGTEMGVTEPIPTFSACFGEAFLVCHPAKYAKMLEAKIEKYNANVYLINTGWVKGTYGQENASRCPLKYTRQIVNMIHSGDIEKQSKNSMPIFGLDYYNNISGIPEEITDPLIGWSDRNLYLEKVEQLAGKFKDNFKKYKSEEIAKHGPM